MADRHSGPRQTKSWTSLSASAFNLTGNGTDLGGTLTSSLPFTVLRMLGEYIIGLDAAPTAQDSCEISVGIGVVSTDAATLGSTAVPDPGDEPDFPWLYWASHHFHFLDTALQPADASGSIRHAFDIRSMRKLKARESLVMVVQYFNVAGTPAMQFSAATTRVLTGVH